MSDNVPLPPLNKRRKLSSQDDIDEAEEKLGSVWDLTGYSGCNGIISTTTTSTKKKKQKKKNSRKKDSKFDKLCVLGAHKTKYGTDIAEVRRLILSLITDHTRCEKIIDRIDTDMKLRAQGANILYEDVETANGRMVKKKIPFLSHIIYANKVPPKGGSGACFSKVEYVILITGCFNFVNVFADELKCDKKLPPWEKGNIGKIERVYIMLNVELELGKRYPNEVWQRTSLYKKVRALNKKKNTDLYSLETRSIFSSWGKPEDIQQDTLQCLQQSVQRNPNELVVAIPPNINNSNSNSLALVQPPAYPQCPLPLRPKTKKPSPSSAFYEAATSMIAQIGNCVQKTMDNENTVSLPSFPSSTTPIFATPSPIKLKPAPQPTKEATIEPTVEPTPEPTKQAQVVPTPSGNPYLGKHEAKFTKFVGNLLKLQCLNKDMDQLKTECVMKLFQGWEIEEYKLHIVNLINYINAQSTLNDLSKLKMIRMDLANLIKE